MSPVDVIAGSRLHFGLMCGAPGSGWHYGGIGMMVDAPVWRLTVSLAESSMDEFETSEAVRMRLQALLTWMRQGQTRLPPVRITALSETGFHSGLGSGTQLTLAAGTALLLLSGQKRPEMISDFAAALGRSRRSAIGTFGFDRGGFIIDHGKQNEDLPNAMDRIAFPEDWRMVILTPQKAEGLSGETEEKFFGERRYLTHETIRQLDHLIRIEIVPAVRDASFEPFRDSLITYGNIVGAYYAAAQGGVIANAALRDLVGCLKSHGVSGAVQSSWGPSICIPASSCEHAEEIGRIIRLRTSEAEMTLRIASGLNTGATIRTVSPEHHRTFG